MLKKRVIARLDIKNEFVIKGIQLEGLRKIGDPNEIAKSYYLSGVDEIIFMDSVAAYYDRNSLSNIISMASEDIFIPITVGGGIRSIADIQQALDSGADKVAINTQALKSPEFITEASKVFGSQCIVVSIEAKKVGSQWHAYFDNGREDSGRNASEWAQEAELLGAGEIMITSVDKEGTKRGMDKALIDNLVNLVSVPLIVSGGVGCMDDILETFISGVDAVALASVLHYDILHLDQIKNSMKQAGLMVRS